ncbi:MAG: hypothetical protein AAGC78_17340 [Cellvibrio sp.]|uniref:hypothetical protein n=1 Tax=Cellvibrio sp. TaxID=1965322 RepID=UPI0031ACB079
MNIDRFSPLLKRTTLLLSLLGGITLLTACGGGSDKKSSASSSSVSSSLRSSFAAASVPANGSGVWPSVKVEAQNPKVLTFQWSAVDGATHYKLFKHDAATGGVVQVGDDLTTTTATDEIGVHVHDWVNNYYYVDACNNGGCQRSSLTFTATEMIKAIGYVKASNTEANDFFGWSIALSSDGKTLAVGAPAEDSNAVGANGDQTNNESTNSGAVYIFVKNNGVWVQQAYLKASNTEQLNLNPYRMLVNDRFGYRVSLSDDGNTLAVSALLEDSPSFGINCNQNNYETTSRISVSSNSSASSDPSGDFIAAQDFNVGAVYIFSREGSDWTQDAYVKPYYAVNHAFNSTGTVELRFGETLALSGDGKTLAVGTTSDFIARSGVFNLVHNSASSNSSARECLEFYPSSPSSASSSSTSTSSSSSSKSSASSTSSYNGGSGSGAVYIYRLEADGWKEDTHVKASNAQSGDAFGASVALSTDGKTLAVGAIGEDSQAKGVNGNQADNSCFYQNRDLLYIMDLGCEDATYGTYGINNGAAYVFTRGEIDWVQEAYLKPASTFFSTLFGSSVDLSGDGNTLAIGAKGDAGGTLNTDDPKKIDRDQVQEIAKSVGNGSTYVFSRTGSTWAQQAYLRPSTITSGGEFGGDVALSLDGNTLAVGSFREASNAKGINGDQGDTSLERAGAVFVFKRDNAGWSQQSYVKASNTDSDDRFGLNVAISGDGKTMAVGAHRESGRGYAAASSGASTSSVSSSGVLDQNDNSATAAGAVYLF